MKTRVKMLKVKIKSLAAEARIIRLEEKKAMPHGPSATVEGVQPNGMVFSSTKRGRLIERCADFDLQGKLWQHRTIDVRQEARYSLLAYAFLRGKPYLSVERKPRSRRQIPDWYKVERIVKAFGCISPSGWVRQSAAFAEWTKASSPSVAV